MVGFVVATCTPILASRAISGDHCVVLELIFQIVFGYMMAKVTGSPFADDDCLLLQIQRFQRVNGYPVFLSS